MKQSEKPTVNSIFKESIFNCMSFKVIVLRNFSWACRQQVHVCFTRVQYTTATGLDYKNYSCIDAYLGKITDGTVTPCALRKIPAGITQCFGLGQSVLRYSLLVSLSSLLLQHCFLCKCDYNPMYYSQCTCTSTTKWKKI